VQVLQSDSRPLADGVVIRLAGLPEMSVNRRNDQSKCAHAFQLSNFSVSIRTPICYNYILRGGLFGCPLLSSPPFRNREWSFVISVCLSVSGDGRGRGSGARHLYEEG
jgi:hypothetical protein